MNDNNIRELARLMPVPAERDLPAGRDLVIRQHLMTEIRDAAAPGRLPSLGSRRSGRLVLAAMTAAGVAAAIVVTALQPASQPAYAAVLLNKIATVAGRQPAPKVNDSEFMYIRSEVASSTSTNGGPLIMGKLHEAQVWLSVSDICRTGLGIEYGQRTPLTALPMIGNKIVSESYARKHMGFTGCGIGPIGGGATYRRLQSLPADPRTLLNLIYDASKGQGTGPGAEAFQTIGDMISGAIVPPRTAAALYRAAALIPGITIVENVKNAVGRTGVAIAHDNGTFREEWIFDPRTLQYIGGRQYDKVTGKLLGESAILRSAFVDKPGQLP